MSITTPPSITALPTPPDPNDRATFNSRAYPWSVAQATLATEVSAMATNVYNNATEAQTQAGTATTQAGIATTQAGNAATSAASALNSPGTNATSSTSTLIGTGSKTVTIQTGKTLSVGQTVVMASSANVANQMIGQITAHNSGTGSLTVNVSAVGGSGTFSDWIVSLSALNAGTSVTWTGPQTYQASVTEVPVVANTGASYTVTDVSMHDLTLTANTALTFPSMVAGKQFTLLLKQDGTGSRTVSLPTSVRWPAGIAPTITGTASKTDIFTFICDGSYWLGFIGGQNFTRA